MESVETKHGYGKYLAFLIFIMAFGYILIHDLIGSTLLDHSPWDSYTLQAISWLKGSAALDRNYSYLELAIYNGNYYVSFPPFPSVVMLPFTLVFGVNTPNNLIIAFVTVITACIIFRLSQKSGYSPLDCLILSLAVTWGSNLMWMSTNGGVWFMAQALNMCFLAASAICASNNRRTAAYLFAAFAVGCRPFSAFAFPPLFVYFYLTDKNDSETFIKTAVKQLPCLIPAAVMALLYMWYNYIRFDSVLEFGHNYLPEFIEAPKGQFNISYILNNLKNIFLTPVKLTDRLGLRYPVFDGFLFYIANPFFILMFAAAIRNICHRRFDKFRITLLAAQTAILISLCVHKTFGGWQFGARYTVDMLILAFIYVIMSFDKNCRHSLRLWEKAVAILGIMFNVYGALAMNFLHGNL